jgi:hypothetical protein
MKKLFRLLVTHKMKTLEIIDELMLNEAVKFEIEITPHNQKWLRIISTRECLSNEYREIILKDWKYSLKEFRNRLSKEEGFLKKVFPLLD